MITSSSLVVLELIFGRCLIGFTMTVNLITISYPYSLNLNETECPIAGHLNQRVELLCAEFVDFVVWEIKKMLA